MLEANERFIQPLPIFFNLAGVIVSILLLSGVILKSRVSEEPYEVNEGTAKAGAANPNCSTSATTRNWYFVS